MFVTICLYTIFIANVQLSARGPNFLALISGQGIIALLGATTFAILLALLIVKANMVRRLASLDQLRTKQEIEKLKDRLRRSMVKL